MVLDILNTVKIIWQGEYDVSIKYKHCTSGCGRSDMSLSVPSSYIPLSIWQTYFSSDRPLSGQPDLFQVSRTSARSVRLQPEFCQIKLKSVRSDIPWSGPTDRSWWDAANFGQVRQTSVISEKPLSGLGQTSVRSDKARSGLADLCQVR